jgi:hypothetical protein
LAFDQITKCLGLVTQYNPLQVAPGALLKADNCVCTRENIFEDRRGYSQYLTLSNTPTSLMVYQNKILIHNGTTVSYDNSGTALNYSGSYSAPTGRTMKAVEAFSNLYVTTSTGVKAFTDTSGTAGKSTGAPRSLDPALAVTGTSGFLGIGFQCAYRVVIKRTDANSNVLFSYPSTRNWVYNSGATTVNVQITLYLPSEVTTSDVIQVYRTAQISTGSSTDGSGDEMALVYQVAPTSTDISNKFMQFIDVVTDSLRGATLYTSPSQEGITQANERPPVAKDIALYKNNYMLYANTSTKQRLWITLVGVGSLTGNSITISGTTYTFAATESASTGQVGVSTASAAAVNIDLTARSLVRVINQFASNTSVYAYYLSGPTDSPGQILIEERGIGASAFTAMGSNTSVSSMFFPSPPVSPATNTTSTSTNQVQKNAIFYSKTQQPEAVPSLNYLLAGSANKEILRIAPLRNSCVIIKEEGVFLLTGDTPASFSISPLDLTVFCRSADSVAILANEVYMLSNQGVVAISETGVRVVSHEIENQLKPLLGLTTISTTAVGASYQSDRHYFISLPSSSFDSVANQTFVYNYMTRTWVRWTFGISAAVVEPNSDRLYFIKPNLTYLYKERKDFSDNDFADPEVSITISAISFTANTVSFTYAGNTPQVGWAITQGNYQIAISSLTFPSNGQAIAVMSSTIPDAMTTGAGTLYPSVGFDVKWSPWSGPGNSSAGVLKQVSEVAFLADSTPGINSATVVAPVFTSNFDDTEESVTIIPPTGSWGSGAWGSFAWGGTGDAYSYRTYVPRNKQRCRSLSVGIRHQNALERLAVAGVAFRYENIGERIGR